MKLKNRFKRYIYGLLEERSYIKSKTCCACRYFAWFHGSAGVCESPVRVGCACSRMKDYSDTCDCGNFRKARKNER